ncbi:MAG TPA: hypothetical protein VMI75_15185 [Polyangiaceae bacterium]|nr:hypothetical protein [Polyangiaceae bacterium]
MAEDPRPPVAIRITRPYANEDEFLEQELETLTRTSVTLLGAQARPQGVVLRFELVLTNGHAILRGEGRVVGFKQNVLHGLGGLTLRFTRLDSRSKALVDKAAVARERRRPSHAPPSQPPSAATPSERPPQPPPEAPVSVRPEAPSVRPPASVPPASVSPPPVSVAPPPASVPPSSPSSIEELISSELQSVPSLPIAPVAPRPRSIPPPLPPRAHRQDAPKVALTPRPARVGPPGTLQAPPARDELLERLRARAKRLDATEVERILSQRKRA